ncbi:MAG: adenylate cyclase [Candidatus Rokubacteria bacterium]|nr:adenylate cyclase [Candidatus Rokubacteria bacterium]
MSTTRLQVTAILKTDLSGSTPRFRATAEADLAPLLREHRAFVERVAAAHDGRMVKPEGDGFWLAFPSVTAAALAAMSMQEELRLAQANAGEDRLAMRIVIALGDALHQDGALVGDTVVLTTRIAAHTPPDEIYLTAAAWLAMNHAEIRTSFVSALALKGFAEPAAVYRIEQRHRTHVIADQYVVVADLKGFTTLTETRPATLVETALDALHEIVATACHDFGGVVRFSAGDAYCLTFTDAERVMAGVEHLATAWARFSREADVRCAINVAVHKATLHAFRSYLWAPTSISSSASSARRRAAWPERS